VVARPCRAGREAAGLEGFRPPFGLGRVTFLCVAKEKSPKERPPRLFARFTSGSFGSPACPTARADGPLAFAIHGFGQSPLRTSLFSRQIGSSGAREGEPRLCPPDLATRVVHAPGSDARFNIKLPQISRKHPTCFTLTSLIT